MDAAGYLSHLRTELDAFAACLSGDLTAPVRHCGGWTLADLAGHLGRENLWSAAAVTERRGDHHGAAPPRDPATLGRWVCGTGEVLLAALDTDPAAPAWTLAPPRTAGFWQRRRCLETLVHRWDAQHALGFAEPLDPALASDGVAEVIDTMGPRQVRLGRIAAPGYAVGLVATDTRHSWTWGPGDPVATVSGTAEALLLLVWRRLAADDPALAWAGDGGRGRAALGVAVTP
jgi:uncharacterized protein (TIGR03083 family)